MKKFSNLKIIPSVNQTKEHIIKLSDKTLRKKEATNSFLTKTADVTLFITKIFK